MDGIQLPQGYRATARRHFTFTTKLTSIAQRAINLNSDVLHNFKNMKNTRGGVFLLVKMQAFSLQLY